MTRSHANRRRRIVAYASALSVALAATAVSAAGAPARASQLLPHSAPNFTLVWSQTLNGAGGNPNDAGAPIALSSPNVANFGGQKAVVVGDRAGNVVAYNLADGSIMPGWPYNDGGIAIDSSPSVSTGSGSSIVYVGLGNVANPTAGSYLALTSTGTPLWQARALNTSTDATPSNGVEASMAVGTLQGQEAVTAGSMGQTQYALNALTGTPLPGWDPWFSGDTEVSTPAIADLYGNGQNEVIEGIGTTAGNLFGVQYAQGGHIRVILQSGNQGQPYPNGGLVCQYTVDQAVSSSPAVGPILGGTTQVIVSGTSAYYSGAAYTDAVVAIAPTTSGNCNQAWATQLDGDTSPGPAIANILGNGQLQVAEGTSFGTSGLQGSVYVLNGPNGSVAWSRPTAGGVKGSISTADLTGNGYQDLLVPTTAGVQVFDGQSGNVIATLGEGGGMNNGFQSAPLVTQDPNGTIGITIAGYSYATDQGVVLHYETPEPANVLPNEPGAWPQFHHDPQLTGDSSYPSTVPPAPPVPGTAVGMARTPDGKGYWIVASDGSVFSYGDAAFHGSMGGKVLNKPIVGMAATPDGGGYWLVATDGGIFSFGDAKFYGSTGALTLNKPIVGMAAVPGGGGYWLVASDGGVFSFGSASFHGSTGALRLNKPVVGMAATPTGGGYWLVASDGGIFSFGDAKFHGSTGALRLNKPVVGMAATPTGGGYWLVASDGGIFTFGNAAFHGSAGNLDLVRPVVGMAPTPTGGGYWLVAADGGIFTYGVAGFYGSRSGSPL
ncbi:MAG: hypothetical protein M0Z62_14945 [Actinomycetota bacterium]|nr:hypothetical protein [Actinomycetota bacterium]